MQARQVGAHEGLASNFHLTMTLRCVALWCVVALALCFGTNALPTRTENAPRPTANARGLKVPIYYDPHALHPRNENMNQDELDEWLRQHSSNVRMRYTHERSGGSNSSHSKDKRQQLGLGDFGLDSFYFAPIGIGEPQMTLNVVLDTGSADFWIADSDCSVENNCPQGMLKYDASKSQTHQDMHIPFGVQYGSGAVKGELSTEKVSLAGYTVSSISFGQASQLAKGTITPPASGIMGMGYNSLSTTGTMPFWQALYEREKMQDYLFTFQLVNNLKRAGSRDVKNIEAGGVFTLGVLDDQQYSGEIAWTDISKGYGPHGVGYWAIDMQNLRINGRRMNLYNQRVAAIDTGTTLMGGPQQIMDQIHSRIRGAQRYNRVPEYYVFPCNANIELDIEFGGHTFKLTTEDLISQRLSSSTCLSSLFVSPSKPNSPMPSWIVGGTFLKTVFSVFDAGKARIGFAELPQGGAQTMSITSATMDSKAASSYSSAASSSEPMPFGGGGGGNGGGNDGGNGGSPFSRQSNHDESWKTASVVVPDNIQPLQAPKNAGTPMMSMPCIACILSVLTLVHVAAAVVSS